MAAGAKRVVTQPLSFALRFLLSALCKSPEAGIWRPIDELERNASWTAAAPRLSLNFSAELEDAAAHGEEDEATWSSCLIAAFGVISRTFAVCSKTSCLPEMA